MKIKYRHYFQAFVVLFALTATVISLFSGCSDSTGMATGAISGDISAYEISVQGDIYVVAVKAENRGHIRNMETEAYPYLSQYAAGYQKLSGQGSYTISGLTPGEYAVWGYMDTGGDGGVNHYDFADPVGWYQTPTNLKLPVVTVTDGKIAENTNVILYQPVPFGDEEKSVVYGNGGGTLRKLKGNHILHIWGTPDERAYALGFLCAAQILDWVNFVVIESYCKSTDFYENAFIPSVKAQMGGYMTDT